MRRIRLQVAITLLAVTVLFGVVAYLALSVTTKTAPDYGGTYVEGVAGNPEYINPLLCQPNPLDQDLAGLIFSGLARANGRGEIVPDLAESWDISADGIVYTFYLREDVVWHDGAPFTADDVVYTISTIQQPEFPGEAEIANLWRTVVVERVDTYTVRFYLREPYAPFLDHATLGILPAHLLSSVPAEMLRESQFNVEPVGTGPYRLESIAARRVLLVSNTEHYGGRPYIDRLEFILYQDDAAVFEGRRRGEVAGIARVLPAYLDSVRQDRDLSLYSAPLSGYNAVYLNLDKGVFQDPAVRQAMMYALDRQRLVDEVLEGQGIVLHSPILPHSWAHNPSVRRYDYAPRLAISTLEEHDWFDDDGDGVRERGGVKLEFTLVTNDNPVRMRLIEAISEQLANVGIRALPQAVPWETLRYDMLNLRRFDAVLLGFQFLPPDPDPYPYWHSSQANEFGVNLANYNDPRVDMLLEEARLTSDKGLRQELYQEFQTLFAEQVPSLLLYQPVYAYAVSDTVQDVQIGPMTNSSGRFQSITDWYIATQRLVDGASAEPTTAADNGPGGDVAPTKEAAPTGDAAPAEEDALQEEVVP